jgi:pre-rRNA-processing protein TSR1
MSYHHRSSSLKQSNKKHKTGGDKSKRETDRQSNVGGRQASKYHKMGKYAKNTFVASGRLNRVNHARQTSANKKAASMKSKRFGPGGAFGPPRFVAVVTLNESRTSAHSLCASISSLMARTSHTDAIFPQVTGISDQHSARITLATCPRTGQGDRDIVAMLDTCKVADIVLIVVPATTDPNEIVDSYGEKVVSALRAQGAPTILGVGQGFEDISNTKKYGATKKLLERFFATEFGEGTKVMEDYSTAYAVSDISMDLDLRSDCPRRPDVAHKHTQSLSQLYRHLASVKIKDLPYRNSRPYMVADAVNLQNGDTEDVANVHITGYLRGKSINVNQLVHLTGLGTYELDSILFADDPCPFRASLQSGKSCADQPQVGDVVFYADNSQQESLEPWAEIDPLAGEQTIFSDTELEDAGFDTRMGGVSEYTKEGLAIGGFSVPDTAIKPKLKKRFAGVSDTQRAWLEAIGSDADDSDASACDDLSEVDDGSKDEDMEEDEEDENPDRHALELKLWRTRRAELRSKEDEDAQFPDEVDTPEDIPARERFARYRGLKSFRTSPWDAKESLPLDYARIFQIENIAYTKKKVMEEVEQKSNMCLGKPLCKLPPLSLEQTNSMHRESMDIVEDDHVSPGFVSTGHYITIVVKNVSRLDLASQNSIYPLLLSGLFLHENKMSVVHFKVKKAKSCETVVKSKDPMELHVGFRRLACKPIFSEDNFNCDKHKYERFLMPNRFAVMTAFFPVTYGPAPVIAIRAGVTSSLAKTREMACFGSLASVNPDRIILKRIVLSGTPVKVKKKTATVKFMFFHPDDVRWFKPLELWTKHGAIGHIRQSIGTHGSMKCIFNGHIKQHDTVCMTLYKRVFPKTV